MNFTLTDDQLAIRANVERIAKRDFAPTELKWESDRTYVKTALRQLAHHGLLGLCVSTDYGGAGLPYFDAALAIEEMAKHSPSAAYYMANTSLGQTHFLQSFGNDHIRRNILPKICAGESAVAIGISEPQAGSAATAMTTKAVAKGDHFILNGRKHYVSHSATAQYFIIYARMGSSMGAHSIGALLVERDSPGFTVERLSENMAGNFQGDLLFEDCRVPTENLLLGEGAFAKLSKCFNLERCGGTTIALGNATGAFEIALNYVQTREQFGRALVEFQAVQLKLADMAVKLESARLLLYHALTRNPHDFPDAKDTAMAKIACVEAATFVTDNAIQLLGAAGYMKETGLERRYRQVRGNAIAGGVMDLQKTMLAGWLSGRRFSQWKK